MENKSNEVKGTLFQKISNSKFALIIAFILSTGVFILSQIVTKPTKKILTNDLGIDFNTGQTVLKIFILIFSLGIMLILNKGNLSEFGFKKPNPIKYFRLFWLTVVVVITSIITSTILFMAILNQLFPKKGIHEISVEKNFFVTIITVWILSSLSETVLTRGLFQSILSKLKHIKFLKLSLPVLATGLFFGLLHGTAFFVGKSIWFSLNIVFFTSCTGVLSAYYREKSDSLIPAFMVHVLANMVGSIPLLFGG